MLETGAITISTTKPIRGRRGREYEFPRAHCSMKECKSEECSTERSRGTSTCTNTFKCSNTSEVIFLFSNINFLVLTKNGRLNLIANVN